jgi:hypothetical protein
MSGNIEQQQKTEIEDLENTNLTKYLIIISGVVIISGLS